MMKKRWMLLSLGMALVIGMTGCGKENGQQNETQTDDQQSSNEEADSSDTAEIEYPNLDVTFEKKAVITLADEVKIEGSGVELLAENTISISEGGEYELSGTLEDGMVYVETDDAVELTLNGVTITNSDGPAILGEDSKAIYLNSVSGTENVFTDGSTYATDEDGKAIGKGTIFSNDDLYFIGDGTITVNGNYKHTIKSDDSIFVESGSLVLSAAKDGINANDTVMVDGGEITITKAVEGLEGTFVIINDGTFEIAVSDDGFNAGTLIEINGGVSHIVSTVGDAVDSNGALCVNGGLLVVHGGNMPENGMDCDQNTIQITGGTIVSSGGGNSMPDENNTQYSILLGSAQAGDTIGILDADGNTVFAYETEYAYENLMVSIDGIVQDMTYTVYSGGTIEGDYCFYGYYENAVYTGGSKTIEFTADSMVISAGGTVETMGGPMHGGNGTMPGNGGQPGGERPDGEMPQDGRKPELGDDPDEDGRIDRIPYDGDYQIPEEGMPGNSPMQEESEASE